MIRKERHKVTIRCNNCGEKFTLVGKRGKSGQVDTGFKQCLCSNEQDFDISGMDL